MIQPSEKDPQVYYFSKYGIEAFTDTTEPTLYPDAFIQFVRKEALDAKTSECEELRHQLERLESEVKFNQQFSFPEDKALDEINLAARVSYRRSQSCARGQAITAADNYENHVAWAAMAYVRKHEVKARDEALNVARDAMRVAATRKECKGYECCARCGPIYERVKTNGNDKAFSSPEWINLQESHPHYSLGEVTCSGGLTKREYFAAMAMQGYVASRKDADGTSISDITKDSVRFSDALIAALNEKREGG